MRFSLLGNKKMCLSVEVLLGTRDTTSPAREYKSKTTRKADAHVHVHLRSRIFAKKDHMVL